MLPPIYTWLKTSDVQDIIGTPPRAYRHQSAPQDTTRPYVTWNMVTGVPENTLSELPKIDRITVDIDCWHQTDAGVEALAVAVRNAIEPYAHMTGMPINLREPETKLYRIGLQFDVWLDRVVIVDTGFLILSGDEGVDGDRLALSGDMTDGNDLLVI